MIHARDELYRQLIVAALPVMLEKLLVNLDDVEDVSWRLADAAEQAIEAAQAVIDELESQDARRQHESHLIATKQWSKLLVMGVDRDRLLRNGMPEDFKP